MVTTTSAQEQMQTLLQATNKVDLSAALRLLQSPIFAGPCWHAPCGKRTHTN